jgi:hypothetical protein
MVLRRVLELGIAIVYFWDLPHRFWGWKNLDQDVTYAEMLEHINSAAYKAYLSPTKSVTDAPDLFDSTAARSIYRELSNTVHAKISTFESSVPDRFIYSRTDWLGHLKLVSAVEDIILDLWRARFPNLKAELLSELPQLNRLGQTV